MKINLLNSGLAALTAQANAPNANKIVITGFKLGDSTSFVFNRNLTTAQGTILFTGTASDMRWQYISSEEVILKLKVDRTQTQGVIGNVLLSASLGSTQYAFALARPFSDTPTNVKLSTQESVVGMDWYLHVNIIIPDILSRFDFSSILQETVEFKSFDDESEVDIPFAEEHDAAIIQEHSWLGKPVLVVNSLNRWWGCPMMSRLDDVVPFVYDGGISGDSYQYSRYTESTMPDSFQPVNVGYFAWASGVPFAFPTGTLVSPAGSNPL